MTILPSSSPYIEMIGGSILQVHIHLTNQYTSVLAGPYVHLSSFTQLWHENTWQIAHQESKANRDMVVGARTRQHLLTYRLCTKAQLSFAF